jgi:hypothetical protein
MIARVAPLMPRFVVIAAALLAPTACSRSAPPGVRIVEPTEGAVLAGPSVRVVLEATGIEIAPAAEQRAGTAHHHLFLDTDLPAPGDTIPAGVTGIIHLGRGQTEFTFEGVTPGQHRVIAVLADPWHVPIKSAATDTVRFTVSPP